MKKAKPVKPPQPPTFVKAEKKEADPDKLEAIRDLVRLAREMEKGLLDLEELIKERRAKLNEIYHKQLPDMLQDAKIDRISIPAEGNYAAADAELHDYYSANIAAGWEEERRKKAFEWFDKNGHGDLIKTAIAAALPRNKRKDAKKLVALIEKAGFAATVSESIHSATLTAWLKEQLTLGAPVPPLEMIGASVGKVVKLKERKS